MKILIVSEMSVPYAVGGGEVRYGLLARELARRGHDVKWLSMRQRESPDEEVIDGVQHLHRGPRIESPPVRPILSMLRFMITVFFHIARHRYDVIDAQTYAPLPSVWLACLLSRQRMVATIHDVSRANSGQWMNDRYLRLTSLAERLLYRLPYRRIIAVSESTASALVSRWAVKRQRICVIPNGVELPLNGQAARSSPRHIDLIFAGRFVPTKNIEDLLEVVRLCRESGLLRRAMLVGDGPLLDTMVRHAKEAALLDVVEFPGRKDNAEVLDLLQSAKVFFHASSREGFPVVMLEALACGTPVVAYEVPGVTDVIDNGITGVLVSERDTAAHARACAELLASNERRAEMGAAGIKAISQALTVATMTDRVLDAYRA
jgi:glycosyltransferase involved in cell wall biosynthesis